MANQLDKGQDMAALGRRGGLIGGNARARALSAAQRQRIARLAAEARWGGTAEGRRARAHERGAK